MKQAFINLTQEQLQYNCLITPALSYDITQYGCQNTNCKFLVEFVQNKFVIVQDHTCIVKSVPQNITLMKEGDQIILSFSFDEIYNVELKQGKPYGSKIFNDKSSNFTIALPFTSTLHTESLKRFTQIIFTPDVSLILGRVPIRPGWNVVESGTGSGSLSHAFAQAIRPTGKLHSFDIVQERTDAVQQQLDKFEKGVAICQCKNALQDGFVGVENKSQQMVFLDLPMPELCLDEVERVLADYGYFVVFLPCIEQIHQLLQKVYQHEFYGVDVTKVHYNTYEYDQRLLGGQQLIRGQHIMDQKKTRQFIKGTVSRTHTGYLIFARNGAKK